MIFNYKKVDPLIMIGTISMVRMKNLGMMSNEM